MTSQAGEPQRIPVMLARDLVDLVDTTRRWGGVRAKVLKKHWPRLVETALLTMPEGALFRVGDRDHRHVMNDRLVWICRVEQRIRDEKDEHGSILLMFLIAVASRLVVEMILRWLDERGRGRLHALQLRTMLRRERE